MIRAMTPAELIQAQLDAWNAHDVEMLLALYAPDACQYEYPDRLLAQGSAALRERMEARFRSAKPRAELLHRTMLGRTVIDHERIVSGSTARELVAIYEVNGDGRIASARFVFGEEQPAANGS